MEIQAASESPTHLIITGSFLGLLVIGFVAWFLVPALRLRSRLQKVLAQLKADPSRGLSSSDLSQLFAGDERLSDLWADYELSLHKQTEHRNGEEAVVARRSTVPAETFFNSQYVVDSRLHTEFFRHLPGVLTGVGIIGTFTGLIRGLGSFEVRLGTQSTSGDTSAAVRGLLQEVHTAFWVSAAAITGAMLVTLVEKMLIASLYRLTEAIAHDIDSRFDAGTGEEYLSRIVEASEDSASQAKILKDALVSDLRTLMDGIASTQIAAAQEQNRALAVSISSSITESLSEPLKDIAGTVRTASGDQSATASRMLQDVLSSFSQRLNELFGGQIAGINDLNRDTAQSMTNAVHALNALVGNLVTANETSSETMTKRMAEAVERLESRQAALNDQTAAFVEQLRAIVAASQSETNLKMQSSVESLGRQVEKMVDALRAAATETLEKSQERERAVSDRTSSAVSAMVGSVDGSVAELAAASVRMQDAMVVLTQINGATVEGLGRGADALNSAASRFAQAGDGVTAAMTGAASVASRLTELAGSMTAGAAALQQTVGDYRAQREMVAGVVLELRTVVELAQREASLTADVLGRIHAAAEALASAQDQADGYLQGVSKVLAEAHQAFAAATLTTLDRANVDFHTKLSSAVQLLSSSIQELDATIGAR